MAGAEERLTVYQALAKFTILGSMINHVNFWLLIRSVDNKMYIKQHQTYRYENFSNEVFRQQRLGM